MHVSCVKPCELDSDDISARRSADHSLARSQTVSNRYRRRACNRSPTSGEGWQHPLTAKRRSHLGIFRRSRNWSTATSREEQKKIPLAVSATTSASGLQFAAVGSEVLARAREARVGREIPTDWFLEAVHPYAARSFKIRSGSSRRADRGDRKCNYEKETRSRHLRWFCYCLGFRCPDKTQSCVSHDDRGYVGSVGD